jgi:hypothetical protein
MVTRVPLRRDVSGERLAPRPRPRMRRRSLVSTLFLSAVIAIVPCASAGTLDQSQPAVSNSVILISDNFHAAQTFTNGITGSLDQVDLVVGRPFPFPITGPLTVAIRPLSGGVPSGPALATASVAAASVPVDFRPTAFVSVALAPPAPVTAGIQYAIVLSSPSSCTVRNCPYHWTLGPLGSPYPAGSGLQSGTGGAFWVVTASDFAFKTYVATGIAPPTSKAQCKKGGWKRFTNPSFKNQGQCVKFVNYRAARSKGKDNDRSRGEKSAKKK